MKGEIIFFQLYMPICNNSIHNSLCSLQMWYIMRKLQREGPQMQKNIPSFSSSLSTPSLVVPKPYVSVNCSRVSSNAQKKSMLLLLLNVVLVSSVYKACVYVIQLNVPKILLSPTDSTGWKFMMIVDLRIYDIGITWVHSQKHCYFQLNIHSTVYPTSLLLTTFFDKEGGIRHTYTEYPLEMPCLRSKRNHSKT